MHVITVVRNPNTAGYDTVRTQLPDDTDLAEVSERKLGAYLQENVIYVLESDSPIVVYKDGKETTPRRV
jgi:hypothetical protein